MLYFIKIHHRFGWISLGLGILYSFGQLLIMLMLKQYTRPKSPIIRTFTVPNVRRRVATCRPCRPGPADFFGNEKNKNAKNAIKTEGYRGYTLDVCFA